MKPTLLQDRVSQAFMMARHFGLDMSSCAPSDQARGKAEILNHPALPRHQSDTFQKVLQLRRLGVKTVAQLFHAPIPLRGTGLMKVMKKLRIQVVESSWSLDAGKNTWRVGSDLRVWPTMDGPLGCVQWLITHRAVSPTEQQHPHDN